MDTPKRTTLKKLAVIGLTAGVVTHVPYVFARKKVTLRVLGTHVTLQEAIRKQAMLDLGINIEFSPAGSAAVLQKASMDPGSFDLYEQWSNSINVLWRAGSIQPIEKKRLTYFNEINSLTKTGKLTPDAKLGAGDAPYKLLNVQEDGTLSANESDYISFLPYVHNVDSFGYNTAKIKPGIAYETESWGWLLDDAHRGKVGIVNAPTIGLFDLALAAQSKGLITFKDIGAITRSELDRLFSILIDYKRQGHFAGYWNSVPESVEFMKSQRVHIESMFSPAVAALNSQNVNVRFAAPKEGYRGWHGVMCLSSQVNNNQKDAAYDYMNWWLSGWAGAFIARQGYYISNPQRSKAMLSPSEWDYWYLGKPTSVDLLNTQKQVAVKAGEQRNGGSYLKRLSNVAVWNSVMPTYDYSLQKWYELISR
ncbi:extracellular solute-binding protein [Pseudoalteromonas agarivorans]|uniref:ABC transporter substrate-binding protein n=1 Tax=Pseudoalteromonas agarivorans TaxID=176102 RepID=UPI0021187916|nr:extracellular solute-binding protein [Pseudoalteromonas agarivorans]MCQ8886765.1 extracellular solute-binding protein [Pseudoalteromonas agarivorans]